MLQKAFSTTTCRLIIYDLSLNVVLLYTFHTVLDTHIRHIIADKNARAVLEPQLRRLTPVLALVIDVKTGIVSTQGVRAIFFKNRNCNRMLPH
jgi:hypothetical protein